MTFLIQKIRKSLASLFYRNKFPHYQQLDLMSCGPTCLRMVAKHYKRFISSDAADRVCHKGKQGISLIGLCDGAEALGFRTSAVKASYNSLRDSDSCPFIVHWRQEHFVVVNKITDKSVNISDPEAPHSINYSKKEFKRFWMPNKQEGNSEGVAILLSPTEKFFTTENESQDKWKPMRLLASYLTGQRSLVYQVILGLFAGALLTLFTPFLTQALVDHGISDSNHDFIVIILWGQLAVFSGIALFELLRGWLLLYITSRINVRIKSDFISSLTGMPLSHFESKNTGDTLQRLEDHNRIQEFLGVEAFSFLFSIVLITVYTIVLSFYDTTILFIFVLGLLGYATWIYVFLRKRRIIDYKRFSEVSFSRASEIHLIRSMPEIKLNNYERQIRWNWERIQAKIFSINIEGMKLEQWQDTGSKLIQQIVIAIILYTAAKNVVNGDMTFGGMTAVMMILGQVSAPMSQLLTFIKNAQDAAISIERISEVNVLNSGLDKAPTDSRVPATNLNTGDIKLENVSFRYGDPRANYVLDNINMTIKAGETTAIVGESGSGKTTLMKLLLKFYEPEEGEIYIADIPFSSLSSSGWRGVCSAVLQDGSLFDDTVSRNIALNDIRIDNDKVRYAAKIACIDEMISKLPLGYGTRIGPEGLQLSAGQTQRLLIARTVYKNPQVIFLDEATSALDTRNERSIIEGLDLALEGKTKLVIAHRLSTVRNANQIYVMDSGRFVESGTHDALVKKKGRYFDLIRNQLELSS